MNQPVKKEPVSRKEIKIIHETKLEHEERLASSPRPDGWEEHICGVFGTTEKEAMGFLPPIAIERLIKEIQYLLLSTRQEDAKVFDNLISKRLWELGYSCVKDNPQCSGNCKYQPAIDELIELRTALSTWEENT